MSFDSASAGQDSSLVQPPTSSDSSTHSCWSILSGLSHRRIDSGNSHLTTLSDSTSPNSSPQKNRPAPQHGTNESGAHQIEEESSDQHHLSDSADVSLGSFVQDSRPGLHDASSLDIDPSNEQSNLDETCSAEDLRETFQDLLDGKVDETLHFTVELPEYRRFWKIISPRLYDFVLDKAKFDYDSERSALTIHMQGIPHEVIAGYICDLLKEFLQEAGNIGGLSDITSQIQFVGSAQTGKIGEGPRPEEIPSVPPEKSGSQEQCGLVGAARSSRRRGLRSPSKREPSRRRQAAERDSVAAQDMEQQVATFSPDLSWQWKSSDVVEDQRLIVVEVADSQAVDDLVQKANRYLTSSLLCTNWVIGVVLRSNGEGSDLMQDFSPEKGGAYVITWRRVPARTDGDTDQMKKVSITQILPSDKAPEEGSAQALIGLAPLAAFMPPDEFAKLGPEQLELAYDLGHATITVAALAGQIREVLKEDENAKKAKSASREAKKRGPFASDDLDIWERGLTFDPLQKKSKSSS